MIVAMSLWPSGARDRYLADQHLPCSRGKRLIYLPCAAPLVRQEEQRLAICAAKHSGEDRAIVVNPFQYLAPLTNPHDCALRVIGCLRPNGAFGVHTDAIWAEALRPDPSVG